MPPCNVLHLLKINLLIQFYRTYPLLILFDHDLFVLNCHILLEHRIFGNLCSFTSGFGVVQSPPLDVVSGVVFGK